MLLEISEAGNSDELTWATKGTLPGVVLMRAQFHQNV